LGIGTSSFSAKLTVSLQDATAYANTAPSVANCTAALINPAGHTSGGTFVGYQLNISGNSQNRIGYFGAVSESTGNQGLSLVFGTNTTAGNRSEKMRLDSSGNFLVGTTTVGISNGGIQAQPDGGGASIPFLGVGGNSSSDSHISNAIYSTSLAQYQFYVGYGGTVFARSTVISSLSDARLKENIVDLDVGLDKIMALKPRKFDWKEGKGNNKKNVRGFIAQELEQVFPDLIDEWRDPAPEGEDPYKSVRQDLMPVLVKAIQEQQAIIESLKARLDAANL
jgi:hypothetical protein